MALPDISDISKIPIFTDADTVRSFVQVAVGGISFDDGPPPETLFGYWRFVDERGLPLLPQNVSLVLSPELSLIDIVAMEDDVSVYRVRLRGGLQGRAYQAILTATNPFGGTVEVRLSLVMRYPAAGAITVIELLGGSDEGVEVVLGFSVDDEVYSAGIARLA